jgi:DNA-binding XRE family transcriptional regulator
MAPIATHLVLERHLLPAICCGRSCRPGITYGDVEATERFGENLLRIRQARKLSQECLAQRAGLHRTKISILENGRRQAGLETVVRLAGALEVSTESLFEGIRWDPRAGEFVVEDPPELPRV